ncbi:MAG TPA: PQQ-binding-like beta-propeller repeat protein [Candidatus Methanofastidiosa archaeon]|nr:PQQ-binding-like beta-propeller repeat protein [Candidatus Methanofastidiosa archaeon]
MKKRPMGLLIIMTISILSGCINSEPIVTTPSETVQPSTYPSWAQVQYNNSYSSCTLLENMNVIWETQVDNIIRQSLVISGGKVFVSGDTALFCLDISNGNIIWEYETENVIKCTPATYNNYVFFGDDAGIFYCIDSNSGDSVWQNQYDNNPGGFSSPLIADSKIFVSAIGKSTMYCLGPETGDIVWQYDAGIDSIGSNTKMAYYSGSLYVPTHTGGIYCLDADTGDLLWQNDMIRNCCGSPVVTENMICVSTINDVYGLSHSGNIIWTFSTGGKASTTISSSGKDVIFGIYNGPLAGNLVSLNTTNGEINWQAHLLDSADTDFMVSDRLIGGCAPTITSNVILVCIKYENGTYALWGIDKKNLEVIYIFGDLNGSIKTHIPVVDNHVFFCTKNGQIYCLG